MHRLIQFITQQPSSIVLVNNMFMSDSTAMIRKVSAYPSLHVAFLKVHGIGGT